MEHRRKKKTIEKKSIFCCFDSYVAPEILAETGYGMEVDCWATGIILYILLCGYPPFKTTDRNQDELFQLIQRGKFTYDSEHWNSISSSKILPRRKKT